MSSRDPHSYLLSGLLQVSEGAPSASAASGLNTLLDVLQHSEGKFKVWLLVVLHALPTPRPLSPPLGRGWDNPFLGAQTLVCTDLVQGTRTPWLSLRSSAGPVQQEEPEGGYGCAT